MKRPMSEWGPGPWDGEPETDQFWTDPATGYRCAVSRGPSGAWCGYVALPDDHPLHGVSYSSDMPDRLAGAAERVMEGEIGKRGPMNVFVIAGRGRCYAGDLLDVHGSVTYSGEGRFKDHPGFWYGFDCSHAGDLSPAFEKFLPGLSGDEYRTLDYTKAECASLARQLQALVVPFPA